TNLQGGFLVCWVPGTRTIQNRLSAWHPFNSKQSESFWCQAPDQFESISSICCRVSLFSFTPEALTFSSSCSGRLAPTSALATFGCRRIQANASWDRVKFLFSASVFRLSTLSRFLSFRTP